MPRIKRKLSEKEVRKLRRVPGMHGTGDNIYLHVAAGTDNESGAAAWVLRYMLDGTPHNMGLGSYRDPGAARGLGLAEVREAASEHLKLVAQGIDPIDRRRDEREAERARKLANISFKDATIRFLEVHESGWKNEKHRDQWHSTLKKYAFKSLGSRPATAVDGAAITDALSSIWTKTPETARRVKQRIERVVQWVKDGMPMPAPSKARTVKHHSALNYKDMPEFTADLRQRESISARALEFTILCAARTNETIGAMWSEIDLKEKIWTVPAERMKAGRIHRVPLSDRAVQILAALPKDGDYVFPGATGHRPLSNMAMLELLRGMRPGTTVHGFRATFSTWANDCMSGIGSKIIEAALAHIIGDKAEAAYDRGEKLAKRRKLMTAWANYCNSAVDRTSKVVPLRARAAQN
jgi:integrase